ncbi:GD12872 [Drosophila simulans]|nr:GD12872 [Drosophila simulans]
MADRRPAWQAMVGIFEAYTWIGFILILIICWLFWFALVKILPEPKYYQQLSLTAINALAVSISIAVQERPICETTRLFFMALTLYGLNVVATYTSKMIGTFQDPGYLHQLDELTEVLAAGIPFGGHEESRDWFENDDDMWIFNGYNISPEFIPQSKNLEAVKWGQRCILSNRMYTMQSPLADVIYAFPYNVFSSPLQMIMKAGFPFLFEMNSIIRLMRDVGIFQKIDADFRYNNTYLNRINKMRPQFPDTAIVLTTEHLKGPFFILVVGSCCAALTFLGELMIHSWRTQLVSTSEQQDRRRARRRRRRRKAAKDNRWQRQVQVAPVVRFTPVKRRKVFQGQTSQK